MNVTDRFLNYIKFDTQSSEEGTDNPTTLKQFELARFLVNELINIGVSDAFVDDHCYVYGHIEASNGMENCPKIGLIAHMDTSPDFSGSNVNPMIIENYNGNDLTLGDSNIILSQKEFPHLSKLKNRTLITTDGRTLLGADNKAGIAEIICACEEIISQNIPHGKITICFTPDEEVGMGTDNINLKSLDVDFAYTIDGGEEGEIVFETFNAASAEFTVYGKNIHPGSAKNVMKNASLIAIEINNMLPSLQTPSNTENYEGFYHLCSIKGDVEKARSYYIIRDHNKNLYEAKISTLKHIEKVFNEKYGEGTVVLEIKEQYKNMCEVIEKKFQIVENAINAIRRLNIEPIIEPIRGGTDGARLSFMGVPCPNLGTGGYCFHGPYEHITSEGMEISVKIILEVLKENWK